MGLPMPSTMERPSTSEMKETVQKTTTAAQNEGAQQEPPKTEAELKAIEQYLEQMEEEYAKHEGGA